MSHELTMNEIEDYLELACVDARLTEHQHTVFGQALKIVRSHDAIVEAAQNVLKELECYCGKFNPEICRKHNLITALAAAEVQS